jgi:hypothetical protein
MEGNSPCSAAERVLVVRVTASPRRSLHSQKADQSMSHETFSSDPSMQHSRTNEPIVERAGRATA